MKRGQIYYIGKSHNLGPDDAKCTRPAIIVSGDDVIPYHDTVEVVFLTTHPWQNLPTHVTIETTGITSTALCERISCVDKSVVGDLCGACTAAEMQAIDEALALSLGLAPKKKDEDVSPMQAAVNVWVELNKTKGERDAYKAILDNLLEGVTV